MNKRRLCLNCHTPYALSVHVAHACQQRDPKAPEPVEAFAALNAEGQIIANSVCETAKGVRLSLGHTQPVRVIIAPADTATSALSRFSERQPR